MGKNNECTTWEGLVEWNMDVRTIKRMYCLAYSKDHASKELERLCKKDNPNAFRIAITDVMPSKD